MSTSTRSFTREQWEEIAKKANFEPMRMALICDISLRQLQRDFEEQFKMTPTKWIRELRSRLVLELSRKGYKNEAIAAELNFGSGSHLCHDFKKFLGQSVREMRMMLGSGLNGICDGA